MKTASAVQSESFNDEPSLAGLVTLPFAELDPGKLAAILQTAEKNQPPDPAEPLALRPATSGQAPARNLPAASLSRHIPAEFEINAPWANSVKLAADFTEWEKFPLAMIRREDGIWFIAVPLPPGHYACHFIVDGQWRDDPFSTQRGIPNPFGPTNSIKKVD